MYKGIAPIPTLQEIESKVGSTFTKDYVKVTLSYSRRCSIEGILYLFPN